MFKKSYLGDQWLEEVEEKFNSSLERSLIQKLESLVKEELLSKEGRKRILTLLGECKCQ